jgi:predicted AlkP superfamily pyrophosphatase or phosphodiesterase
MNQSGAFRSGIFFVTIFSILIILPGFKKDSRKPFKNYVVVISFDGFRWDYNKQFNTPNFNKLAKDGVHAERMISSFPTKTFPNHYTIATGLYPDHHGLIDNSFSAPDLGLYYRMGDRAAVENPAFYGGEPMWETAEKQGVKAAAFFWVGSEAPVGGKYPTYWKKYDGAITYGARIDTVIKWLGYPREKRPELVNLYFDEPDLTSHETGPLSTETGKEVTKLDSILGVIRLKLSSLPEAKMINLIVLSDHGMGSISSERYINIKDVVPNRMIASISGGNPVYQISPAQGKSDSVLYFLNSVKGMKAWRKSQLPAKWNYGTNPRIPEPWYPT